MIPSRAKSPLMASLVQKRHAERTQNARSSRQAAGRRGGQLHDYCTLKTKGKASKPLTWRQMSLLNECALYAPSAAATEQALIYILSRAEELHHSYPFHLSIIRKQAGSFFPPPLRQIRLYTSHLHITGNTSRRQFTALALANITTAITLCPVINELCKRQHCWPWSQRR